MFTISDPRIYDRASARYWPFLGERTVERLCLPSGASVLDVPCGPGSSVLPAARAVGQEGRVIAVDLSGEMVGLARANAARNGLRNIEFAVADMRRLEFPDDSFDAVICVLGIFFVEDMVAQARELWRLVKPGGKLAVTNFDHDFFSPVYAIWREAVQKELALDKLVGPWDRANHPDVLRGILEEAGATDIEIECETRDVPMPAPEEWWDVVMGTGMRKWIMELDGEAVARVREGNLRWIREHGVGALTMGCIYASARKPTC
ncbi:MAG: class I SAM-dependent methyltransferase [Bryobacteraceae bacterium]